MGDPPRCTVRSRTAIRSTQFWVVLIVPQQSAFRLFIVVNNNYIGYVVGIRNGKLRRHGLGANAAEAKKIPVRSLDCLTRLSLPMRASSEIVRARPTTNSPFTPSRPEGYVLAHERRKEAQH